LENRRNLTLRSCFSWKYCDLPFLIYTNVSHEKYGKMQRTFTFQIKKYCETSNTADSWPGFLDSPPKINVPVHHPKFLLVYAPLWLNRFVSIDPSKSSFKFPLTPFMLISCPLWAMGAGHFFVLLVGLAIIAIYNQQRLVG